MTMMFLPLALLASATAFPAKLFEQPIPNWPSQEALNRGMEPDDLKRRPYHFLKNITSECIRADEEWWGKFFCFVILILCAVIATLAVF